MMHDNKAIHHTGLKTKIPMDIGMDNPSAVNADNCCGEKFFDIGIVNKLQATSYKGKYLILIQFSSCQLLTALTNQIYNQHLLQW